MTYSYYEEKAECLEELERLTAEREAMERVDGETVLRMYNETKDDILEEIDGSMAFFREEIARIEKEIEEEEEDADWSGVDPGFASEADYLRYKYG